MKAIDFLGCLQAFWREGDSLWVRIGSVQEETMRFILHKGFIAVDGTSLTVRNSTKSTRTITSLHLVT